PTHRRGHRRTVAFERRKLHPLDHAEDPHLPGRFDGAGLGQRALPPGRGRRLLTWGPPQTSSWSGPDRPGRPPPPASPAPDATSWSSTRRRSPATSAAATG